MSELRARPHCLRTRDETSARACDLSRRRHARREGGRSDASRAREGGAQRDATTRDDAKD